MSRVGVVVLCLGLAACDTAGLRPLQATLTLRYDSLRVSLSLAAHDSLRAGQDQWVAFWPRVCDRERGGDSVTFACARQHFADRLATLTSSDEVALGVRTYPRSFYRIVPSSADDPAHPQALIEVQRVGLDATITSPREQALHEALMRWLDAAQGNGPLAIDSAADLRVDRTLHRAATPGLLILETRRARVDHRTGARSADTTRAYFSIDAARPLEPGEVPLTDRPDAADRR